MSRIPAGCSVHEIAAVTGHASLSEVERYTKEANRKRLAMNCTIRDLIVMVPLLRDERERDDYPPCLS